MLIAAAGRTALSLPTALKRLALGLIKTFALSPPFAGPQTAPGTLTTLSGVLGVSAAVVFHLLRDIGRQFRRRVFGIFTLALLCDVVSR
jgi:hypothetical protein